ncbi:anti-sigma factor RsiW [Actinomadura pelletieri DSM 43383]|uniref:Anti-sigma factor RsiW n=1 Tax=Actinomadura pelletieri DSM 43383 TaxID=1120940 RepID=A0A495QZD2_9ACTN|nr:zf-HC2 domain-containing protein [Actinomadura pelletieri]RKS79304.1 anti-sigma factor RsiW [Actinomadura pelletieri DSM 43383]
MNPAHLDYDVLADLAEGLLEDDEAASVNAHLDTCAECRDLSADLADVSRLLAEAPAPSMPAELAERIDTAIAAESLNTATVVSLEQRRGRRHWRILSAAAAAVVVLGGGAAVGMSAMDDTGGDSTRAATPPQDKAHPSIAGERGLAPNAEPVPAFAVTHSRTHYRAGTLAQQAGQVMSGNRELRAADAPDARLRGCVLGIVQERKPVLVDRAEYEGKPATVIAVPGDRPGKLHLWVVGPECSAQNQHVLRTLKNG